MKIKWIANPVWHILLFPFVLHQSPYFNHFWHFNPTTPPLLTQSSFVVDLAEESAGKFPFCVNRTEPIVSSVPVSNCINAVAMSDLLYGSSYHIKWWYTFIYLLGDTVTAYTTVPPAPCSQSLRSHRRRPRKLINGFRPRFSFCLIPCVVLRTSTLAFTQF